MNAEERRADWSWRHASLKSGADAFKESLLRHRLRAFYHWAPVESLESILTYGIRCATELRRLAMAPTSRGYGNREKKAVLSDYVYLMVTPYFGLIARRGSHALLEIEPAAAWTDGSLYVPGNSARSAFGVGALRRMTDMEHFEAMFAQQDLPVPVDYQAEILVPGSVSSHFIRRVTFSDQWVADGAARDCSERITEMPYPPKFDFALDLGVDRATAIDFGALF